MAAARLLALLLAAPGCLASPVDLSSFVKVNVCGFGRYQSAPALFLEQEQGGDVLPVPIPSDSVMAVEQCLSPERPAMLAVLLHAQAASKRDDCLFDNLPWKWNPSPQAKRDAFARFSGRGYPRDGYPSPYHLMLDMMRRDACADVARVLIEDTAVLGDGLVVGGCLVLQRRLPQSVDSGSAYAAGAGPKPLEDGRWATLYGDGTDADVPEGAQLCECTAEEALGVAMAVDGGVVMVERRVWESAALPPQYNMQRGKMRLEVMPKSDEADLERAFNAPDANKAQRQKKAPPLPWEIQSLDELMEMPLEDKALSALAAGLRLPRARDATDERLVEMLEPLLDEMVRRKLRVQRALDAGEDGEAAALEAGTSRRGVLLAKLQEAVADEKFGEAAELAMQLRVETSRRIDVTQDEGSYDRYLDQDDWYAQSLARERERLLEDQREKEREKEERLEAERQAAAKREARRAAETLSALAAREAEREQAAAREEAARAAKSAVEEEAEAARAKAAREKAEVEAAEAAERAAAEAAQMAAAVAADRAAAEAANKAAAEKAEKAAAEGSSFRYETAAMPESPADDTWTSELEASVRRAMLVSFDNLPPQETEALLSGLVDAARRGEADAERSLRKLGSITRQLQALERQASTGAGSDAMVQDEARTLYSQIRMWGKDGERYTEGSWLNWLEGLRNRL